MNQIFNKKVVRVSSPLAIVDNASWTCQVVDTQNYDFMEFIIDFGAMDIAMVALKVSESDVKATASTLTGGTDVPGTTFGTSVNDTGAASTLPSATSDDTFFSIVIDLRGRKRYMLLVATGGDGSAGTYLTAIAELSRAKEGPLTALQAGFAQRMIAG